MNHAHDFALRIAHGDGQDRFRPVAGVFIELAVDRVLRSIRQVISIVEDHSRAVQRDKTGDGFLAYVHGDLFEGHRHGIVLRQLEAQFADRLALLLVRGLFSGREFLRLAETYRVGLLHKV